VRHSLTVRRGENKPIEEEEGLHYLCCRYYHLFAAAGVTAAEVKIYTKAPLGHCRIKAALVGVDGTARQGQPVFLKRQDDAGSGTQLIQKLEFPRGERAYVLLVVCNVNIPTAIFVSDPATSQPYRLEVTGL
jgi:hypothetical protein